MPECAFKHCLNAAVSAPRITLVFADAIREWEIPVMVSLQICEHCKPRVTAGTTISKDLIETIRGMRPGSIYVSAQLEWVPFTHPEYVAMQRARPN
jgi:hypothetical protein